MKRYERIITITMLAIISLSNVATPAAYAAEIAVTKWPIPGTKINKGEFAPTPKFSVDAGSVLAASTSLLTVGSQSLDLSQSTGMSAHKRIPVQMQQLAKKVYRTDEDVTLAVTNPDNEAFTTTVQDDKGQAVSVPITENNNGSTTTVDLAPSDSIKPGMYKVIVTDQDGKNTAQDFSWGVLALNTDKSLYHPGETADISMAVLNDQGDMVCDATLELRITNKALGVNDVLSTSLPDKRQIIVNPQCQHHDFSLQPDYEGHYQFGKAGTYQLQLTATTKAGTHMITDDIQVRDTIAFDLQRLSATRIYPPNTYPMTFNVKANQDFTGTVTETVPDSFTITPATESAQTVSYTTMQTVYLNSNDPAAQLGQAIAASSSGGLVMPFHGNYPITQGFGTQLTDPTLQAFYIHYGLAGHDGIDFGLPMNTPLYAVDDGVILQAGPGDYGTTIIVQHGWGESYYGHLSTTAVTVGSHVLKGQLIGYSGMTGEATGPHLHFGMKPLNPDTTNGYYGKVDPMPYLPIGQGQPIAALGASANPVANAVYNTTVLGASDSAATPTPAGAPSSTPAVSPTAALSSTVSIEPTTTSAASGSAAPSIVPSPTAIPATTQVTTETATPPANTSITVLQKQILLDEQLANSALTEKVKIITWHVSLKKGESTSLGYDFQAPHESPQYYLLGPVHFYDNSGKIVFQEQRQWQIASDDVGLEWYQNTSGSNFNGYSWQYRRKIDISASKVSAAGNNSSAPTVTFMDAGGDQVQGSNDISTTAGGFYEGNSGSPTIDCSSPGTTSETGPCSYKFNATSGGVESAVSKNNILANTGRRISMWVKYDTLPNSGGFGKDALIAIFTNNDANFIADLVNVTSAGKLCINDTSTCGSDTITTGSWYRIDASFTIGSNDCVNQTKLYLNGKYEISATNQSWTGTCTNTFQAQALVFGSNDTNAAADNVVVHIDDIYVDSGTDLSDPGNVHVTNKKPVANGNTSSASGVGIPTGYTTCDTNSGGSTGLCTDINEEPLDTGAYLTIPTNAASDPIYSIQNPANGDVNIASDNYLAHEAWAYARIDPGSSTCTTPGMYDNGIVTTVTLTSSYQMFTNVANGTTYPEGYDAVGFTSCSDTSGTHTDDYAEGGMMIAYIDASTSYSYPSVTFMDSGGDATEAWTNGESGFWDGTGGTTAAVDCTVSKTGPCSLKFTDSTSGSYINKNNVLSDNGTRVSEYFKFSAYPSDGHDIFYLSDSLGTHGILDVDMSSSGVLSLANDGTQLGSNGMTLSPGTWYRISISYKINTSTNYSANVYVNGALTISYSQTSGGHTLDATGTNALFVGLSVPFTGVGDSVVANVDDVYVDSGSDLSDPGDVHVTAKRPTANGTTASWTTNGTSPSGGIGTGHAPWVSQRPIDTASHYMSTTTTGATEEYSLESASSGDVDISSDYLIADDAWLRVQDTSNCTTNKIINNGIQTTFTNSSGGEIVTNLANMTSYPPGSTDVGQVSCTSADTSQIGEAGVQFAYTTTNPNALNNFPVLVKFTSDSDLNAHAQPAGSDIIFTDSTGNTLLPFEIESYNAGSLTAWVDISSLSAANDTIIYMYYGNPSAASQANVNGTWNKNYGAVWHLTGGTEPINCASASVGLSDSTSNNNTLTNVNSSASTTGEICAGVSFNGTNQDLSAVSSSIFNPGASAFSVTAWINTSNSAAEEPVFGHFNSTGTAGWIFAPNASTLEYCDTVACPEDATDTNTLQNSTWTQVAFVRSGGLVTFYQNGNDIGADNGDSGSIANAGAVETIGKDNDGPVFFNGSIDEVEYSQTGLTPGWILTEYNNQNSPSTFYSVGTVETNLYAPTLNEVLGHGEWFNSAGTKQPFVF